MHERTRRFCCRAGFLLFCLIPTMLLVGWIGVRRSSSYLAAERAVWESSLSQQLGLTCSLDTISRPRRGVTLLEGIELADPETGEHVGRIRVLELARTDRGLVLLASQPEFQSDQLELLWDLLHERILRGRAATEGTVQLIAGEVTLHAADQAQTFTDVRCQIEMTVERTQASMDFRVAGLSMSDPARFRAVRNRQVSPPATTWELHTGPTALPCSLLARRVPGLGQLGQRSHFQGVIWATHAPDGWHGDVTGRFSDLDLDRLVTERFPHKLAGTAEVVLSRARFHRGRLIDAAGSLTAREGVVSRSLLVSTEASLRLGMPHRIRNSDQTHWKYRALALGFELNADGLTIRGHCDQNVPEGTLLVDQQGWMLVDPREQVVPAVALVRALVPQNEVQVPATKETDALLQALPLPGILAPQDSQAQMPHSPLRLKTQ